MTGVLKRKGSGLAEEMALRLKACTALAEDPVSVPSTHVRLLGTGSIRASDVLFWLSWVWVKQVSDPGLGLQRPHTPFLRGG